MLEMKLVLPRQRLGLTLMVTRIPGFLRSASARLRDVLFRHVSEYFRSLANAVVCGFFVVFGIVTSHATDYTVSAGGHHSCALDDSGVVCWGTNTYGQVTVPSLSNPVAVSAGGFHSCAIDDSGVECWGSNGNGQTDVPLLVSPTHVSAGGMHSCAIDDTGVVCWGRSVEGQVSAPTLIDAQQISAGFLHSCALDDTGLVCWGYAGGAIATRPAFCSVDVDSGPIPPSWPDSDWSSQMPESLGMCPDQLDLAMEHAFQEGNDTGAVVILRHGNIVAERYAADRVSTDLATSWSVAKSFTSALVGTALADDNIQDLDESASNYITEWENTDKAAITIRHLMTVASGLELLDGGDFYGAADQLQVSLDRELIFQPGGSPPSDYAYSNSDVMLAGEIVRSAVELRPDRYLEQRISAAIGFSGEWWRDTANHTLTYCCLDATPRHFGRFGLLYSRRGVWNGTTVLPSSWVDESTASALNGVYGYYWWPAGNGGYSALGVQGQTITIYPDFDLIAMRFSRYERMGDGSTVRQGFNYHLTEEPLYWDQGTFLGHVYDSVHDGYYYQATVPSLIGTSQVDAGYFHSCALEARGISCWGRNDKGQTTVPDLSNPTEIAVGSMHSCALDDTGVVCWGSNGEGQATVPALINPIQVSSSGLHTCALDDTGVVCWGEAIQQNVPGLMIDPDGDGVTSQGGMDAFPRDSTETRDSDGDGVGDNADADDDGDGFVDVADTFPLDANEHLDSDSDGVGDNADAFPTDGSETVDTDSDGIGNNADLDDDADDVLDSDEISDGTDPLDRYSCLGCFSFDIDVDGDTAALTDGLLVLRYLFGFSGSTLTVDAITSGATRTDTADIEAYLESNLGHIDIDGDGGTDALTDGLLLLRYLFGFEGATLIEGAIRDGAERTRAGDVESFINSRIADGSD